MSQVSDVTAKQECEKLMTSLLPTAQSMLGKCREFYPYGGYIELDGQIRHVGVKDETTEYPQFEDMIDVLENFFLEKARAHECKATAIICDVRVKDLTASENETRFKCDLTMWMVIRRKCSSRTRL
jgi:hypothetical protein